MSLNIAVRGGEIDAMALLLTDGGTVGGDGDVVFHGAPAHSSGAVRLTGDGTGTAWLEVGLASVEARIERVLVVASTEKRAMRDVAGLSVEAFAPDGTSVARYDVTDAAGETAMVLAELYRRAGGWKFRAVGQGYANGLAGLATDHGVDVAEPTAPVQPVQPVVPVQAVAPMRPVPMPPPVAPGPPTGQQVLGGAPGFKVPGPPMPMPAPVPLPPPSAAPAPLPPPVTPTPWPAPPVVPLAPAPYAPPPVVPAPVALWSYGPVFEPLSWTGRDNDVITVEGLPPGPVVVQLDIDGDGYTGLTVLDRRNKEADNLVNSTEDDFWGRVLAQVPQKGPLRLKLEAEGPWRVEVSPLATARHLTEDEVEYRGPDVLLHTGGAADLTVHYRGDENLIVNIYELAGHHDSTSLPDDENVLNEIGKRRETVPLPEGPLVVQFEMADGPWRAGVRRLGW
ncbi:TerD family protein [Streptomyces sp. SR27]|uniref:TerD family protein n=1 Tax=Streptomyces sp. SR27 TaxID=3076630 RepID=UPI00295B2A8B|nr:TerD family protein [Streptomyces sp. SR27]MDV9187246.1 TerD family protein [Streptomyces sp. SR27]